MANFSGKVASLYSKGSGKIYCILNELINVFEIQKTSTNTYQLVQENILLKEQNGALETDLAALKNASIEPQLIEEEEE